MAIETGINDFNDVWIRMRNHWTKEIRWQYTFEYEEFMQFYREIRALYEELKPKKKEQPKLRRLKRINVR